MSRTLESRARRRSGAGPLRSASLALLFLLISHQGVAWAPEGVWSALARPVAGGEAGRISGMVVDEESLAPLGEELLYVYDATGTFAGLARTDAEGRYETTEGLDPGTYFVVTFFVDGYVDELYDDIVCLRLTCDVITGTPVEVVSGQTTGGIDFALSTGGAISGRILDSGAQGIPFARAEVFDEAGVFVGNGFGDGAGNWSSTGLPGGTYFALAYSFEGHFPELYEDLRCVLFDCDVLAGSPIPVVEGQTTSGTDFTLEPGGRIAGRLFDDEDGAAVTDAVVYAYDENGGFVTNWFAEPDGGHLSDFGLPTGNYYVTVDPSAYDGELFDDLPCPEGACDPTLGDPVAVVEAVTTDGVDFALSVADGPVPSLSASGSCPGGLTISVTGGSGEGRAVLSFARSRGEATLPGGPCAGTSIDLDRPRLLAVLTLDADGSGSRSFNPGGGACGALVQGVDLATCEASNLLEIPGGAVSAEP